MGTSSTKERMVLDRGRADQKHKTKKSEALADIWMVLPSTSPFQLSENVHQSQHLEVQERAGQQLKRGTKDGFTNQGEEEFVVFGHCDWREECGWKCPEEKEKSRKLRWMRT